MKKCLYCDHKLDQNADQKECLNCKFSINGSVNDAIKRVNKNFKIALALGVGMAVMWLVLSLTYVLEGMGSHIFMWILIFMFAGIFDHKNKKIKKSNA